MGLSAGTRLGPYEILAPLGAGGMGQVYRAFDVRLGRTVAVKVLAERLALDPVFRKRFEMEARSISSLNHPHICVLHDVGRQDSIEYLVMEHLEGVTLAARLAAGPLTIEEVLEYGIQIADALSAAHRCGISHRDLKPGNVMLTKTGAKLLDFGLAKLRLPAEATAEVTATELTQPGAVLGTLQYMSPEQILGQEADARSDVFALGGVLFEMATGRKAFDGIGRSGLTAVILKDEPPPISSLTPASPPTLDRLVKKCFAKDPEERWQSAHDLKIELQWILDWHASPGAAPVLNNRSGSDVWAQRLLPAAAVIFLVAAMLFAAAYFKQPKPDGRELVQLSINPPEKTAFTSVALSPDGHRLAFATIDAAGRRQLWVRALDEGSARAAAGSEGAWNPFWSPDSRWIGFFADAKLKKIEATGGVAQVLANAFDNRGGGTWSRKGVIVFSPAPLGPLQQVSETGGAVSPATWLDRSQQDLVHLWPQFLPDSHRFVYYNVSKVEGRGGIYEASIDSREKSLLLATSASSVYTEAPAGTGYLLYARGEALLAQHYDPEKRQARGEPVTIARQVTAGNDQRSHVSVSDNGVLVYDSVAASHPLRWYDRSGKVLGVVEPAGSYMNLSMSPDHGRLALNRDGDIWLLDLKRGGISRFTFHPAFQAMPAWSRDGLWIAFTSTRDGEWNLYQKRTDGSGEDELLVKSSGVKLATDWSPDGRFLLFDSDEATTGRDLWAVRLADRKLFPILVTEFNEHWGRFSPDGRWIAYTSNETGRSEIFVRAFSPDNPGNSAKWHISTGSGGFPCWRADGKELFYLGENQQMMAVSVKAGTAGQFEAGIPRALFATRALVGNINSYVVTSDGQRFLVDEEQEIVPEPATVVLNWQSLLKR
jgi:eukaryotic-like serine/threonine-protein kinase